MAINRDPANIKQTLFANKLPLNLVNTEYLLIRSRHNKNYFVHPPKVHVGDKSIKRAIVTKALGLYNDQFLSCNNMNVNFYLELIRIEVISKNISSGIGTKTSC